MNFRAHDATQYGYIASGDWHGCKQINAHPWYAGTTERNRFPRGAGIAWR